MAVKEHHIRVRISKRNIEHWKSIDGFPGYLISDMGRILSKDQKRFLKPAKNKTGYYQVSLCKRRKKFNVMIHSLVINNFGLIKPSRKHQCNHKDGDKSNNWNTNLEWMTPKENVNHAFSIGLMDNAIGENHFNSKLTDAKIIYIRRWYFKKLYTLTELSKKFKVRISTIKSIINFKTWKHVKE